MNIEHKTTPIEHWIMDGKAYRLATENDVGKKCLRSDTGIEEAVGWGGHVLTGFDPGGDRPYIFGIEWRFAYIQDDSLLTPPTPPTKPIDWTKPVRTKSRHPVRVLCTDGPDAAYPVIGIIADSDPCTRWTISGKWWDGKDSNLDLENAPQRIQREYWVNVYKDGTGLLHATKDAANCRESNCLACVKITIDCEEGEGL